MPQSSAYPAYQRSAPAGTGIFEQRKTRLLVLAAIALLFFASCFAIALTRAPWYDEGFFADPAFSLVRNGHLGISALDDSAPYLPSAHRISMRGIREHLYTAMPLHPALLAGWYKLFGFGLLTGRVFTMFCGLAALLCWYSVVWRLTGDRVVPLVTAALMSVDYGYVLRSSEIRMDALSAAFGFGGLAVYLALRERNFSRAIFFSHALVCASAFTHPNGAILAFAGLLFLTLYYDLRRIRIQHVAVALFPYLIGGACWALYISRDLESFKAQFSFNASQGGRLNTLSSPLTTLKKEFVERYLGVLGGLGDSYVDVLGKLTDPHGLRKLKLIIPFSYFAGIIGLLSIKALRQQKGYRTLLFLTGIYFFVLAFTDGRRSICYIVHIIPVLVAPMAALMVWLWRRGRARQLAVAAWVVALCAVHLGGIAYQARQDTYHKNYLPTIAFLEQNVKPDQEIIGPGILGFGLRFPPNLMDDFRLGFLNRQSPQWIVVNDWYAVWFLALHDLEPDAYRFARERLDHDFEPVYRHADYTVYRKR